MNKYSLILYDCDGTVYDTYPGITANLKNTLAVMGYDPMPEDFNWRLCVGPPLEYIFESMLGVDPGRVTEACALFRKNYSEICIPNCVLFPGMEASLKTLYEKGFSLGIASSKNQNSLDKTMRKDGCDKLFRCILGPTDKLPLSKTELIIHASEILDVPADEILMIGDTFYDAEGAAKAGIDFAAALWGYGEPSDFDVWPCVCRASSPDELCDFILNS